VSERLSSAVVSITPTQRRRYFWAAWWTGAPTHKPFRKPDASHGGARSLGEARAEAERAAGRHLTEIAPYWARAFKSVIRGEPVPPMPSEANEKPARKPPESAWSVLGLTATASAAEVRRAYRKLALETHPDRGGDAARFREVQRAYESIQRKLSKRG
jgi:DnaJ-domain-containing protein 1